jgi:hypothetical protein
MAGLAAGERAGQFGSPWPGALQAQDRAVGMAHHPCSDVEQPVAQRLGFGHGQLAVQQQRLRPAGQILGAQDQF